jgi:DNA-binding response OmpR family regulator
MSESSPSILIVDDEDDVVGLLQLVFETNGFEALAKLRSDPKVSHIPIVIITAKSDTEYAFDAGKLGADDYIIKPVSMEGLLDIVRKYIP